MLVGYYTKTASFLTWILTLSLHNRNYLVLHGGDVLQRVILFYALFLPLGDCYSIDNAYFNSVHLSRQNFTYIPRKTV
jgi:hypothetical protein